MAGSLRILIVTSSLKGGGAGNHILNLARYLRSVGIGAEIVTISRARHQLEDTLESEGVRIYRLPVGSLAELASPSGISRLKEIVRTASPDIIHGHLYHGEMTAALASALTRVPMVATRHSCGLEFNGLRRFLAVLASSRVGALIAVSRDAAEEARGTGVSADRVTVVHNGVDTGRFVPLDGPDRDESKRHLIRDLFPGEVPDRPVLIGAAGALKKVKNYPLSILAVSRLLSLDPGLRGSLRFVIAGEGDMREELERLVAKEGLEGHIAMPGYLGGLDDYFPCLDIFLMTSITEGVPIALLEAMSSGVACLASDTGDIAEVIGDAGRTFTQGDLEGCVEMLSGLVADEAIRKDLGHLARVRVLERFNLDVWGDGTVKVYNALQGRKAR